MSKRGVVLLLVMSFLILSFGSIALAQNKPVPKNSQKFLISKNGEFIEILWIWELTKTLNLNEEKLALLIPKLKKLDDIKKQAARERRDILFDLRNALRNNRDDATIEAILNRLDQSEKNFINQRNAIEQEIKSVLTVKEWAQFVLLKEDFAKRLRAFLFNNARNNVMQKVPQKARPKFPKKKK